MDIGLIFALLGAAGFAGNMILVRRGTFLTGESFTAMTVFVFVGALFFALLLTFSSGWEDLLSLSWYGLALLGTSGIMNFIVGRFLVYSSIRLIGANRTSPLLSTATFYPVIFGVILLNESFTIYLGVGVLAIIAGVILISAGREEEITKLQ
ncbi:EamA family transporter, partial [Chloroflexota bacterium]